MAPLLVTNCFLVWHGSPPPTHTRIWVQHRFRGQSTSVVPLAAPWEAGRASPAGAVGLVEEGRGASTPAGLVYPALVCFLAEEKANTHLLLGMCLDSCARYLLFSEQPSRAQGMYERAVRISEEILGDHHPQVSAQHRARACQTGFRIRWQMGTRGSGGGPARPSPAPAVSRGPRSG